jgi:hypothetical protein
MQATIPRIGDFYYHHNRNPKEGIDHEAYYILGIGIYTQDRSRRYVIAKSFHLKKHILIPLENFFKREFQRINNIKIIEYLRSTT